MEDSYFRSFLFENGDIMQCTLNSTFAYIDGLLKIYNAAGCIFCMPFALRDDFREITGQEKSFELGFYEMIEV